MSRPIYPFLDVTSCEDAVLPPGSKTDSLADRPGSSNSHSQNVGQVNRFVHIMFTTNLLSRENLCQLWASFGIYSGRSVVCFESSGTAMCCCPSSYGAHTRA